MGKKHFTEEQIAFALRQSESGTSVAEIIRKLGISEQTFYRWKKRFAGLGIAELRRLRIIEEENRKLKQLVADLSLDKKMLPDVRRKPRRRKSVQVREARSLAQRANDSWSMDFVSDQLVGEQRFRLLTLVDNHSRESLAIEVGRRLTGDDVVRVLEGVASLRGKPQTIRVDDGPEFISRSLDLWAYFNGVKLDFSRPGKPRSDGCARRRTRHRQAVCREKWVL